MWLSSKIKKPFIFSEGGPEEIHFSENDGRKKLILSNNKVGFYFPLNKISSVDLIFSLL